jgi:hypothetical protein
LQIASWAVVAPVNDQKSFKFVYVAGVGTLHDVCVRSTKIDNEVDVHARIATGNLKYLLAFTDSPW